MSRTNGSRISTARSGGSPIPREHGAWAMLYAPTLACLVGLCPPAVPFAVYLTCVTAVFFGQSAAGLLARGRGGPRCGAWLAGCAATAGLAGALLVLHYGYLDLVWVGAAGAVLLGRQVWAAMGSGKRIDRSALGEALSVGGLALTGPAAYVVAAGGLGPVALGLWLAFWTKYLSGIFHVKTLVGSLKAGREATRWRVGRGLALYHLVLLPFVAASAVWLGASAGWLVAAAYVPLFARSAVAWLRLGKPVPKLRTVGLLELSYTLWFVAFAAAALHQLAASP